MQILLFVSFLASTVFLGKYKQINISRRRVAEEKVGIINSYRQWRIHGEVLRVLGPSRGSKRGSAFLQAGPRLLKSGAPLLITSVGRVAIYVLPLSVSFWALGGVDTVTLLGPK